MKKVLFGFVLAAGVLFLTAPAADVKAEYLPPKAVPGASLSEYIPPKV